MNPTRVAVGAVVVLLVLAAGILGLRSWVGIDAGERLADEELPGLTPSATTPAPEPTPTPTPEPSESPSPEPTQEPQDEPTPSPSASLASAGGIASEIQARLDQSGRRTAVTCPQAVPAEVGTAFTCRVAFAESPLDPVAVATVNIVGPDLRYVWSSTAR